MKRPLKTFLIFAIVALVGAGVLAVSLNSRGPSYEIGSAKVDNGPVTMSIETSGTVEALSTIQVGCEVTGRILEMSVDHDQPVKKDQVICKIDPELVEAEHQQALADHSRAISAVEDARIAIKELRANLPFLTLQAQAQTKIAEAALVEAKFNYERIDELFKKDNAPKAEWVAAQAIMLRGEGTAKSADSAYQLAKNDETVKVDRAEKAIAQAEATLKQAEARLNFAKTRVDRCTISSPIDGIVLKRYMDPGTTVTAAFQVPILFMLAPPLDEMRVSARVSESDIGHIRIGQTARFTIEGRQKASFEGTIEERRNQPDIINNVVTYTVAFKVKNDEQHTLIPGLSVNVIIEIVDKKDAPRIANAALRFKPPISLEERQTLVAAAKWPERPARDAAGNAADYCSKSIAWRFDDRTNQWLVVPLWIGITDNVNTEIVSGAKTGDGFVRRFIDKSGAGFNFKDALKLARPDNRTI
jgi:HlyD family secretion protein